MRKLTTKEFIKKVKKIHGDRYDYKIVKYTGSNRKIQIICRNHGTFEQVSGHHLRGNGCPKCSNKSTTKEFIKKSLKIHKDKYDYSMVEYESCKEKIIIICNKHGKFKITPSNHLSGSGCSRCSYNKKKTSEEFIIDAMEVHGNKYNYSMANYITEEIKIVILCKKHGEFLQTPHSHLKGQGCRKCIYEIRSNNMKMSQKEFIEKSTRMHRSKYDYSMVEYDHSRSKIIIICKDHGKFLQRPDQHMSGSGCPKCKYSIGEIKIENILKGKNVNFIPQYILKKLRYKYPLRFDFGILDKNKNLLCLIEFNGKQHYAYAEYFHKNKRNFKISQKRDELKIKHCIENDIKLFTIRYNENVEKRMHEIVNFIFKNVCTILDEV